jgi:taurine dioxygenase
MTRITHHGARTLDRLPEGIDAKPYERFTVSPLTPHIGAEIDDVDLAGPLDDELVAEIQRALLEWKVIFFRDQAALTAERHLEVARLWGEPEANPFFPTGDSVAVSRLAKDAQAMGLENIWHSDHSFMAAPALGSVLRSIEVPPAGGDTMWADMGAAYDNLPDDVKERVDGRTAIHDWVPTWGSLMSAEQIAELRETLPAVEHPVVVRHPRTGRRLLYVNEPFTTQIVGLPPEEGRALLDYLVLQARIPEFQVRFRWTPDSVAIWDNTATQHYAINDYYPRRRVMERVAIAGSPLA